MYRVAILSVLSTVVFTVLRTAVYLPLSLNISQVQLNRISIIGNGILLGYGLAVIVPEGFQDICQCGSQLDSILSINCSTFEGGGLALAIGFVLMIALESLTTKLGIFLDFEFHEAQSDPSRIRLRSSDDAPEWEQLVNQPAMPDEPPPDFLDDDGPEGTNVSPFPKSSLDRSSSCYGTSAGTAIQPQEGGEGGALLRGDHPRKAEHSAVVKQFVGLLCFSAADGIFMGSNYYLSGMMWPPMSEFLRWLFLRHVPVALAVGCSLLPIRDRGALAPLLGLLFAGVGPVLALSSFLLISVGVLTSLLGASAWCRLFAAGMFLYSATRNLPSQPEIPTSISQQELPDMMPRSKWKVFENDFIYIISTITFPALLAFFRQ
uniref:Uncharacterized protein n=1 Tax=Fibrocapsa japonica TaxID=94617 RepID=A0A7S2V1S3_9STRA|mmetsp:Transcript_22060/g.32021  ORF Transcript_22060/g.32021 Transcript_22060/m.32021 type:complete len:376 (+) Transcript_22060:82-1209(+)